MNGQFLAEKAKEDFLMSERHIEQWEDPFYWEYLFRMRETEHNETMLTEVLEIPVGEEVLRFRRNLCLSDEKSPLGIRGNCRKEFIENEKRIYPSRQKL